jgi:hypothetical protein
VDWHRGEGDLVGAGAPLLVVEVQRGEDRWQEEICSPIDGVVVYVHGDRVRARSRQGLLAVVEPCAPELADQLDRVWAFAVERHGVAGRRLSLHVHRHFESPRRDVWLSAWFPGSRHARGGDVDYLLAREGVDDAFVAECERWARGVAARQGIAAPEVKVDDLDERGLLAHFTSHFPCPDGLLDLQVTFDGEPPWGATFYTARVVRRSDRAVLWQSPGNAPNSMPSADPWEAGGRAFSWAGKRVVLQG